MLLKIEESGPSPLVFAHAKRFYRATKAIPKIEIAPYLVNACFTIELLLKSMRVRFEYEHSGAEGIKYRCDSLIRDSKHDLVNLYNSLPVQYSRELETRYHKEFSRSFLVDLQRYRNAFLERRYEYEGRPEGIMIGPLEQLLDVAYSYARELVRGRFFDGDEFSQKRP